jgi:TP901 family phage tail tape measure protein
MPNEEIRVDINADTTGFDRGINSVVDRLGGTGTVAIAGAALAAGAAITAFVARGVSDFARLESGMNEVFTLLPGISQGAMDEMTQGVQDFSKKFGVLPDEVVPALYQALSAGVPPENVFAFLETSVKTATGGVSDLETAVDGITSATNAYGKDVLSAADASDSMFTAVRLGKTTIDQLAGAVSKTAPLAGSLGIGFDEINAALAAMTAQGDPTADASTKIRGALAELSKSGTAASGIFEEIAGESFPDFIEGGGTFQDALTMMADHADSSGGRITDMFGSIEAGQAAQMLTSTSGRELMESNLQAMADKAGATDAAYQQMDQGLARTWDRIKANAAVMFTEVGERMAPVFEDGANAVLELMPGLMDGVINVFDSIGGAIDFVRTDVIPNITDVFRTFEGDSGGIFAAVRDLIKAAVDVIVATLQIIVDYWNEDLKPAIEAIEPLIAGIFGAAVVLIEAAIGTITHLLEGVAALLRGDFKGAWESVSSAVETIVQGFANAVASIFTGLWETIGEGLRGMLNNIIDGINSVISRINNALEIEIPDINFSIPKPEWMGGGEISIGAELPDINPPNIPNIPHLKDGGIVGAATLALIGEAGPEAVIPLDRLGDFGGNQTIIIELDGQVIAETAVRRMPGVLRLHGV